MNPRFALFLSLGAFFSGLPGGVLAEGDASPAAAPKKIKDLKMGDPAPPLAIKEFVKGKPIQRLEKGKVYVVEFTKLICPPCHAMIPYINELHDKYPDVTFIEVFNSYIKDESPQVKALANRLGIKGSVAMGADPEEKGSEAEYGKMWKTWPGAFGHNGGVPFAMVVDKAGKVVWMNHPVLLLDGGSSAKLGQVRSSVLEKICAGKWDYAAAAKKFEQITRFFEKQKELTTKLMSLVKAGDARKVAAFIDQVGADDSEYKRLKPFLIKMKWAFMIRDASGPQKQVAIVDQAIAEDPKLESEFAHTKFVALTKYSDGMEAARTYGKRMVDEIDKDNPNGLINITWVVIGAYDKHKAKEGVDPKLLPLALQAALRAYETAKSESNDAETSMIANTLARVYFLTGDIAKAVEIQTEAVRRDGGIHGPGFEKRLEQYKQAAKAKSPR